MDSNNRKVLGNLISPYLNEYEQKIVAKILKRQNGELLLGSMYIQSTELREIGTEEVEIAEATGWIYIDRPIWGYFWKCAICKKRFETTRDSERYNINCYDSHFCKGKGRVILNYPCFCCSEEGESEYVIYFPVFYLCHHSLPKGSLHICEYLDKNPKKLYF